MATVAEITARYENFLLPVPTPRSGVCVICKRSVLSGWPCCYQCKEHRIALSHRADVVAPIALAVKHDQWAHELSSYKNSSNPAARTSLAIGIGAVLWRWLESHEMCVADYAGVDQFPLVTAVPSTRGRQPHPLGRMLKEIVKPTSARYADLLHPNPDYPAGSRDVSDNRFHATKELSGEPVMLIDDQWTSGSRAQSAASALKVAGASAVAVVVLGRHFDRRPDREDYREAASAYYSAAKAQGWRWTACCICNKQGT